jgi:hypothetical protein
MPGFFKNIDEDSEHAGPVIDTKRMGKKSALAITALVISALIIIIKYC